MKFFKTCEMAIAELQKKLKNLRKLSHFALDDYCQIKLFEEKADSFLKILISYLKEIIAIF